MPQPFRILHLTDTHLLATPDEWMRGVNTDATLRATLDRVRAENRPIDLVLATGDLTQDESRSGYLRFRELTATLGAPVACLPGNHDSPATMREVLGTAPFQYCGTVVQGSWTLVLLDSVEPGDDGGVLSAGELQRLEETLSGLTTPHALVALHHHPLPMHSRWLDSVPLRNPEPFLAVLDRHVAVRGVLWGHVHQASERTRNGVRFISSPSTCAQFLPGSSDFRLDTRPPAYRWLHLAEDGTISTEVHWVE